MKSQFWLMAVIVMVSNGDAVMAQSRFPAPESAAALKRLRGDDPVLPAWALAMAEALPRTTGAMLHLDAVHRTQNPLGPILAGKLRWVAADAVGCEYAKKYAEADLVRAGMTPEDVQKLGGNIRELPEKERLALQFAHKMTKAAHTVTDEEFAEVLKEFGPDLTVALVHTLAHANFQNRIFLALGVTVETGGPLAPVDPFPDTSVQAKVVAPDRPVWNTVVTKGTTLVPVARPEWSQKSPTELIEKKGLQKSRASRIPLPPAGQLAAIPASSQRVVWSQVSLVYQPLLTKTWFETMGIFQQEAKFNRVFSNSYFWVVTRSNDCFY